MCLLPNFLFPGLFWKVWSVSGILQADSNWMAAGSQDGGRNQTFLSNTCSNKMVTVRFVSTILKKLASALLRVCNFHWFLSSGGEEQLKSHLETLPNPPAVPVWRRYGQTYEGRQSFLYFSFVFNQTDATKRHQTVSCTSHCFAYCRLMLWQR